MAMKKYAVLIDWKAGVKPGYGFDIYHMEAKTLMEAMEEAETRLTEDTYLVKILEKSSNIYKQYGSKNADYNEILVNRGNGWHAADEKHCEGSWMWTYTDYGSCVTDWLLIKQLS